MKLNIKKYPVRFYDALTINLQILTRAIFERKILIGFEEAKPDVGINFFGLSYNALYNDMFARALKVLDLHPDSASFWYLCNCDRKTIDSFIKQNSSD